MVYTIGETAKMLGVLASTLRYYDKQGLFPEMTRVSGIRKFDDTEIDALSVIECLKRSGLEIKDIKQFMDWCMEGASTYPQRKELFERQRRQVEAVTKLIDNSAMQSKEAVGGIVRHALSAASEKAEEVQSIIGAWSNEPGNLQRTPENKALLERVRASDILRDIAKYLGRFREIFAQGKRNGYTHGRGEKYSLELGSDLSRALTSELAMLAAPETLPLFLRKYQRRQIKQYRRREPIYKGAGAMICCLDESGSTAGECAAWGKAVALTLLDIAESEGRKFALIHFSGPGRFQTDRFLPKQATVEDKLRAAETFLDGGTDFCTPMNEALRLMQEEGFDNADIVFITDGECLLPEEYISNLQKEQSVRRFTITGILLDQGNAGMDFSLKPFCQNIYRTSELTGEAIVRELVNGRV